jgi:hypothetical protein
MAKKDDTPKKRYKRRVALARIAAGIHFMKQTGYTQAIDRMMDGNWQSALNSIGQTDMGKMIRAAIPALAMKAAHNAVGPVVFYSTGKRQYSIF